MVGGWADIVFNFDHFFFVSNFAYFSSYDPKSKRSNFLEVFTDHSIVFHTSLERVKPKCKKFVISISTDFGQKCKSLKCSTYLAFDSLSSFKIVICISDDLSLLPNRMRKVYTPPSQTMTTFYIFFFNSLRIKL